jgi:hypothetical protein
MQQCVRCEKADTEVYRLVKCPVCYSMVCDDCAVRLYGRYFCSQDCATNFFFIVEDE